MMKKHNFSAGPCILPQEVMKKASEAVVELRQHWSFTHRNIPSQQRVCWHVMEKARSLAIGTSWVSKARAIAHCFCKVVRAPNF